MSNRMNNDGLLPDHRPDVSAFWIAGQSHLLESRARRQRETAGPCLAEFGAALLVALAAAALVGLLLG